MDMFEIMKDINLKKSFVMHKDQDFPKQFNDFMIARYFSMSPETTFEANMINFYNKMPKHAKYLFLSSVIEKKDRFLKYIKNNEEKEDSDMIKYVSDIYLVNRDVARGILMNASEEEKKEIKEVFTKKALRKR